MSQAAPTFTSQARKAAGPVLTWMAPVFAAIGFIQQRYSIPAEFEVFKVVCLIIVHTCITLSITSILAIALDERTRNRPKSNAAFFLAAFYGGIDIWLVHSGLGWIFDGWSEAMLYIGGVGYTGQALLRDWVEQRTPDQAPPMAAAPRLPAPQVSEETQTLLDAIEASKTRLAARTGLRAVA